MGLEAQGFFLRTEKARIITAIQKWQGKLMARDSILLCRLKGLGE